MSKDLIVYTDPLKPGICQVPVFAVGDDQSWTLKFNNGTAFYDPGSVSVRIGFVTGLENISYPKAFRFVDRLNFESVGTFSISGAVPGSLSWDTPPWYYEGQNGVYLIRGFRPLSGSLRSVFIISPNIGVNNPFLNTLTSTSTYSSAGSITIVDQRQMVVAASLTNPGSGYTSQPSVGFSGGGGSGAAATAIINGQGFVTAVVITNTGSGYTSAPVIAITGGGGSGAAASPVFGVQFAATSVSLQTLANGNGSAINPSTQFVGPAAGATAPPTSPGSWLFEYAGFEVNQNCFVRDAVTLEVLAGVTCTPVWDGRYDTSGNKVYDDALLVIHPRVLLTPTFTLGLDGVTYSSTFTPITSFVQALLRYRRSAVVDLQIFGAGRLLYTGSITVVNSQ